MLVQKNFQGIKDEVFSRAAQIDFKKAYNNRNRFRGFRYNHRQQVSQFLKRRNTAPFAKNVSNQNCLLKFEPVPFIDKVVVNSTDFNGNEAKNGFIKLLKHDFNKAEVEEFDVYKGEYKFKEQDNISIKASENSDFDMVMQIILPSDLYYLYLALGTLGVNLFNLNEEIKNKIKSLFTANVLDRIAIVTEIAKKLLDDQNTINFLNTWITKVIEEKQLALLNTINFYLGRRKKNINTISKEIEDALIKYKENPQDYNIFKFLMNSRYTPRLGNISLKVRNPLYVLALLIMCSKQQLILYHDETQILPDVDTIKVSRFIKVPAKNIILLGVMNLNPSITLYYPMF